MDAWGQDVKGFSKKRISLKAVGIFVSFIVVMEILFLTHGIGYFSSGSMEPLLETGGFGIVSKWPYMTGNPKRGDIIIFDQEEIGRGVGKRVVGLPGEEVIIKDGCVYVDNQLLVEDYLPQGYRTSIEGVILRRFEVPEEGYFVLGDNREESFDSRYWIEPYVYRRDIKGKLIWYTNHPILKPIAMKRPD